MSRKIRSQKSIDKLHEQRQEFLESVAGVRYRLDQEITTGVRKNPREKPRKIRYKTSFDQFLYLRRNKKIPEPKAPGFKYKKLPDYICLIDLFEAFPSFMRLIKKHRSKYEKDVSIDQELLLYNLRKVFPKFPAFWLECIVKYIEEQSYKGPSVVFGMSAVYQSGDMRRYKVSRPIFHLGKTRFKTLLKLMILSKNIYYGHGTVKEKLFKLKQQWPLITSYYGLGELPDLEHLSDSLAKYNSLCGCQTP